MVVFKIALVILAALIALITLIVWLVNRELEKEAGQAIEEAFREYFRDEGV